MIRSFSLGLFLISGIAVNAQIPSPTCNYAPGVPPNDVPCTAISVTPGACFDGCNVNASDQTNGQGIGADCQSHGNNIDVWYTFVADSTGFNFSVFHDSTIGGFQYTASSVDLVLYRVSSYATGADTCSMNALIGIACWEDDGSRELTGTTSGILIPGQRYYFLVSSATVGGENPGSFRVCFDNIPGTPPAAACSEAHTLCDASSFHETDVGFVPTENITTNSCFSSTKNQVKWYQFTFATSGTFGFNIVPDGVADYDWILWNTSVSPCAAMMPFPDACNWSGCSGSTGYDLLSNACNGNPNINYNTFGDRCTPLAQCPGGPALGPGLLNVNAGETWTLLIDNWSTASGYTFNFSSFMTAQIGPQSEFSVNSTDCDGPGLTVQVEAAVKTPGFVYKWEMGDGTIIDGYTATHTYPDYADRVVRLSVQDTGSTQNCFSATELQVTCPLAVRFGAFYGKECESGISLHWSTLIEENSDYFDIERSADGMDFEYIGRHNAAGNSHQVLNYEFVDLSAPTGASYYRLKQVDADAACLYTEIIEVTRAQGQVAVLEKIVDLFGRETQNPEPGQIYLYLYSDGTVRKKMIVDR